MGCHLCIYWTPENGCNHYEGNREIEDMEQLISDIIANEHKKDYRIIETNDFKAGIKSAIRYFKKEKLLINL